MILFFMNIIILITNMIFLNSRDVMNSPEHYSEFIIVSNQNSQ